MLSAAIAALLAACSEDTVSDNATTTAEPKLISFNIVGDNMSTRSEEIGSANIRQQHFSVWAYPATNSGWNVRDTLWMDNVDIHWDDDSNGGEWVYTYSSQKAHWPKDAATMLNFYAVCPATDDVSFYGYYEGGLPQPTNTIVKYSITNGDGTVKNKDFMIAYACFEQNKTYDLNDGKWPPDIIYIKNKKVQLTFRHALSDLRFKIKTLNSATRAKVRSITLGNVASLLKWQFTIENSTQSSQASRQDGLVNIPLIFNADLGGSVNVTNEPVMLNSESPVFLPPQSVLNHYSPNNSNDTIWTNRQYGMDNPQKADTYLALDCDVWLGEKKVWDGASDGLLYLPFYLTGGKETLTWLNGKRYTYTINLSGGFNSQGKRVITTGNEIAISIDSVE